MGEIEKFVLSSPFNLTRRDEFFPIPFKYHYISSTFISFKVKIDKIY